MSCQKTSPRSRKPVIVFQLWGLTLPFGATLTSIFRLHPFFLCVCLSCNSRGFYPQGCPTLLGEISHTAEHYANYGSEEPRPTKKKKEAKNVTAQWGKRSHAVWIRFMMTGLSKWSSVTWSTSQKNYRSSANAAMMVSFSFLLKLLTFWLLLIGGRKKNKAVSDRTKFSIIVELGN